MTLRFAIVSVLFGSLEVEAGGGLKGIIDDCCCRLRLSLRRVPAGRHGDVPGVGPGAGHPGAVRRPSAQRLRLPVLPAQCPAGPVLPPGARRRLPLPAGRTPLHPGGARRSGGPLGPNDPRPVRNRAVMSVSCSTNSLGQKLNCSIN